MASNITIECVKTPHRHREFFELGWKYNAHDPDWVPPLRIALSKQLNRAKCPFFNHGEAEFFLARNQRGEPVGRIAAIHNRLHEQTYDDGVGFFGYFECDDDPRVARELMRRAAEWCKGHGLKCIRGPFNYSINDENPGVLVEGFNGPPLILMAHNPRYYGRLLTDAGMHKCKDMYAYLVTQSTVGDARFQRVMRAVRRRAPDMEFRPMRMSGGGFGADLAAMLDIYNQAWEGNWGFLKITDPEVKAIASDLKPIVNPAFTGIAEIDGKPVAMAVCVPNVNEILRKIPDGRLFPTGWYKLLTGLSDLRGIRTMLMGVLPEWRGRGIDAVLVDNIIQNGWASGTTYCELSWVLEDNEVMNSLAEKAGGTRYRTYRIYEAEIDELILA